MKYRHVTASIFFFFFFLPTSLEDSITMSSSPPPSPLPSPTPSPSPSPNPSPTFSPPSPALPPSPSPSPTFSPPSPSPSPTSSPTPSPIPSPTPPIPSYPSPTLPKLSVSSPPTLSISSPPSLRISSPQGERSSFRSYSPPPSTSPSSSPSSPPLLASRSLSAHPLPYASDLPPPCLNPHHHKKNMHVTFDLPPLPPLVSPFTQPSSCPFSSPRPHPPSSPTPPLLAPSSPSPFQTQSFSPFSSPSPSSISPRPRSSSPPFLAPSSHSPFTSHPPASPTFTPLPPSSLSTFPALPPSSHSPPPISVSSPVELPPSPTPSPPPPTSSSPIPSPSPSPFPDPSAPVPSSSPFHSPPDPSLPPPPPRSSSSVSFAIPDSSLSPSPSSPFPEPFPAPSPSLSPSPSPSPSPNPPPPAEPAPDSYFNFLWGFGGGGAGDAGDDFLWPPSILPVVDDDSEDDSYCSDEGEQEGEQIEEGVEENPRDSVRRGSRRGSRRGTNRRSSRRSSRRGSVVGDEEAGEREEGGGVGGWLKKWKRKLFNPKQKTAAQEDYVCRYVPTSFRRWAPSTVGTSALGGIAYLADFAIGANIAMRYGTTEGIKGILLAALLVFLCSAPAAFTAAYFNLDLDLISRGSFGYYGSILTNLNFVLFTIILFALEGSIMAQGFQHIIGIPVRIGFIMSTLIVLPPVIVGMKALAKLQTYTTPLWLFLMGGPILYLVITEPETISYFTSFEGDPIYITDTDGGDSRNGVLRSAGVCLALMTQIAEQIDYLRCMPKPTPENNKSVLFWTTLAGPGWVIFGATKQTIGMFIGTYLFSKGMDSHDVAQPVQQFIGIYSVIFPSFLANFLALLLVVVSQIKINVTNAYCGSLGFSNSYTRITKKSANRLLFLLLHLFLCCVLMQLDAFEWLEHLLSFYACCAIAWVVSVASDLTINKYILGFSPRLPEYRKGMVANVNPVGLGSLLIASSTAIFAFFGGFGEAGQLYPQIIALVLALCLPPIIASVTLGRYYTKRRDDGILAFPRYDPQTRFFSGKVLTCYACEEECERPDVVGCLKSSQLITVCSICLATDKTGEYTLAPPPDYDTSDYIRLWKRSGAVIPSTCYHHGED